MRFRTHPGEFLQEVYLKPNNISINKAAAKLGVSPSTLSRLIKGDFDLTCEMAVRLSKLCNTSVECWMNLQLNYSISKAYDSVDCSEISEAEIKKSVDSAWSKELSGESLYISSSDATELMKKKLLEIKSK